jgi:hypothetical protein
MRTLRPAIGAARPQVIIPRQEWPRGLVHWWPLLGPTPSPLDRGPRQRGMPTGNAGWLSGTVTAFFPQFGAVAEGTGGGDLVPLTASLSPVIGLEEASLSYWCKLRNATPSSQGLAGPGFVHEINATASFYPDTDGTIKSSTFNATRNSVTPRSDVDRTAWHLVTVTTTPGTNGWTFYQNAMIAGQATGDATIASPAIWAIGGSSSGLYSIDGWFTDLRMWNRCLSPEEVSALWDPKTRWDLYRISHQRPVQTISDRLAALTGTALDDITEADIVAGDKVIEITLTNATWVPN